MHRERFNTLSHAVGAVLALVGLGALLERAARRGDAVSIAACGVYGATLLLLYTSSSLYHAVGGQAKALLRRLDHSAIPLLIAGSYTPFALVTLRGPRGLALLGAVWALATLGVLYELTTSRRRRGLALPLYLLMGWLAVFAIGPLAQALPLPALALVVAGGVCYTLGVPFYALDKRLRWAHGVFHVLVLAGSGAHFAAVYGWVA